MVASLAVCSLGPLLVGAIGLIAWFRWGGRAARRLVTVPAAVYGAWVVAFPVLNPGRYAAENPSLGGLQAWCHGAGGIGTFFQNIAADVPDQRFLDAARLAAVTIRTERRQRSRVGLCCGVAGDLLLDRYAAAPNAADLAAARDCARALEAYRDGDRPGLYRYDAHRRAASPGLMIGAAGVGAFLLRLADPRAHRGPALAGAGLYGRVT